MSLATRCPSCGTVFRVVQDQLKVSEGWVRCGRCNSVFNAAEVLFDIDSGTPVHLVLDAPVAQEDAGPAADADTHADTHADTRADTYADADTEPTVTDWTPPPRPPAPDPAGEAQPPPPDWSLPQRPDSSITAGRQEPRFDGGTAWQAPAHLEPGLSEFSPSSAYAPPATDPGRTRRPQREEPLLRTPSTPADDGFRFADAVPPARDLQPASRPGALQAPDDVPAVPSFLRGADHAALWRRPAVHGALVGGVLLLALGLVAQLLWTWRDTLAAHLPASEPALRAMCRVAGCQVQPLRRIDALAVDSSGLNRLDGSTLYRLQLVLHNRADTALMMPALDLSLTDAQGKLVARRVLQMAELGAPQQVLQAGQELPIKVLMSTGERRIDGYTVELFYP
jgi:predicted Zn finger-like uncharacterized protein